MGKVGRPRTRPNAKITCLYLDADLVSLAKQRGLNIGQECNDFLRQRLEINSTKESLQAGLLEAETKAMAIRNALTDIERKESEARLSSMPEEAKMDLVRRQYLDKKKWDKLHGGKKMDDAKWENFFENRAEWLGMDPQELKKALEGGG